MDAETRKRQARSLEQQGQIAEALGIYRQILADLEGTPAIWQELPLFVKAGDLSLRLRDTKSAISMYEQAAKRYAVYGSSRSVIALCAKILRVVPSRSLIYPRLALLMVERGHISEARAVLASYAEVAQLDRTARELEDLSGRSDDEVRPILEMLIEVSDRAEQARLQAAAARRDQPQSASEVRAGPAEPAQPESRVVEDPAQHERADQGPGESASSSEIAAMEATVREPPAEEEPEEPSSSSGGLRVEQGDETPKPPWMDGPEPEVEGSADSPTATWERGTDATDEEAETPTPEWMLEPEPTDSQEADRPVWARDGEPLRGEEETPKPAWMREPETVERESEGAAVSDRLSDVTGSRKVMFSEMQTRKRSRGAWVGLAAVLVVVGAALVWFRIIPIGTFGLGTSAPQSSPPTPALVDSATEIADDSAESFAERPLEATLAATPSEAEAEDTAVLAATPGEAIAAGDSATATAVPLIVVVDGLPVESVAELSSEGRSGYRVVQRFDNGEPITLILLSLDGDSADNVGAEEITLETTGDNWTVGSMRFGTYLVNASAGVGADSLEVLLRRLISRPLPY